MKKIQCCVKMILKFRKMMFVVLCIMAVLTIRFEAEFIINLSNAWISFKAKHIFQSYDTAPLQQCQRNQYLGKCCKLLSWADPEGGDRGSDPP